ncbi:acyltransferase domain-containing protein, partial [Mycobacterium basiliense]
AGAGVVCGRVLAGGSTVFVFPGQGAQWLGMGSQLYAAFPVFAEAFDVVVGELDLHLRCGLRAVLWGDDERLLDSTEFAQPALFAVEVALYRLLESWGMRPGLVMGHSVGELTAAYVAGALCLEDAALLVVARGRLMQGLPEGGAMCAVQATEDEVGPMLGEQVSIAAVNAPGAVVISGVREAVRAIADRWGARGRRVRELAVSHAFHSALMEPMIAEFKAVAAQVCVGRPSIPVVSNVTGQVVGDDFASAQYWVEHIRSAVRFADGVRWAHAAGAQRFVEVGPGGGLTSLVEQSLVDAEIVSVPTLVKDRSESLGVTVAAARAFVSGVGVDWAAVFSGSGAMRVPLPTYAFQHERFWLGPPAALAGGGGAGEVVSAVVGDCGVEADGAGLAARLRGLSGEQQYAVVLELVCEHAAAVLGRDGADEVNVEQAFSDSGFNSLSEVELRNRLKIATGAALPATIVFDYPTPTALARYLITHADGNPNPTTAECPEGEVDSLAQLFLQAHDSGREQDGWKMVALASNMRERMTVPVRRHDQYSARLLTPGVSDVALLCIPTLTVLSDVQEYREMAKAMAGRHSVYSLPLPGFCPDDALPQDQEMIMESICGTILDMVGGGERFVLAGYSSGGLLAYALGCYLAKRHQRNPLGVALIDTYLPCQIAHSRADGEFEMTEAGSSLSRKVIETARALNRLNATRLTAADAYASIFHSWQPGASIAPLLNIVAKDETLCGDDVRSERLNRWRAAGEKVAYSVAEVPGDHFEMITTSSGSTATALHDWISDRAG